MSTLFSSTSRESLERLAIYGIIRGRARRELRREQQLISPLSQNDMALRFPVHVTLRGPFWGPLQEVTSALFRMKSLPFDGPIPIVLDSPALTENALAWRPVDRSLEGWHILSELHRTLTFFVRPYVARDDVPPDHQQAGFLPHVTLGWGVTPALWKSLGECRWSPLEAQIRGLALARYPDTWPASGRVAVQPIACEAEEIPHSLPYRARVAPVS